MRCLLRRYNKLRCTPRCRLQLNFIAPYESTWHELPQLFMKKFMTVLCLGLIVPMTHAQATNEVQELKRQMQLLQEHFEKVHEEDRAVIDALSKKVDQLAGQQATDLEKKKLEQELATQMSSNAPAAALPAETKPAWSPAQPITLVRAGSAYMNISFDTMMAVGGSTASDPSAQLQLGDHDPQKNGFSLRDAEIALDGAVDPYLKGF